MLKGHTDWVSSVSFSHDGRTLASGSADATVRLWNVAARQDIATLKEHRDGVTSVSFSRDGRALASGSWDTTVKLWNAATHANTATLEGHTDAVRSVSFAPDGKTLASGGEDSTVKLWDVETELNFTTLAHVSPVTSVSFSRNGMRLASGTADGTVELWDTSEWVSSRLDAATEVKIPDPNLRTAIATALGLLPNAPIFRGHMETLTTLGAPESSIRDLSGIEWALNLKTLYLEGNSLSSVSPLSGLTHLRDLRLSFNPISDLSPVSRLANLTTLYLDRNQIADISAISGLTNLRELGLDDNSISDVSPLSGLLNLTNLYLDGNQIADLSPVSGLTSLGFLSLRYNSISDLSPLVSNTGLGEGDIVVLERNPLSYASIYTYIPTLQGRGVEVSFIDRTPTALLKISGDAQTGESGAALANPFVVEVRDRDNSAFAGVPVTYTVTRGGGRLSVTSTQTDANGRASSTLTLGQGTGTNTVKVSAAGVETPVTFAAVARDRFVIPDSNLRAAIESTLGKSPGSTVTLSDMAGLTQLVAKNADISDLTGLEHAANLRVLDLGWEEVNGEFVNSNSITNLAPLSGLTNLEVLYLHYNDISNISAISGLTKLRRLWLAANNISDISAVLGLTNLSTLYLSGNNISDISAISGLTNLTWLGLEKTSISNISPLISNAGLGEGDIVVLERNPLSYASIYTYIPTLQGRGVEVSFIDRTPTALLKISGDAQTGESGAALANPFVVEVRDRDNSAFAGVPVTYTVTRGGGRLSVTSTQTDANGRASSTLTLGQGTGTNTVKVSVAGVKETVIFSSVSQQVPVATSDATLSILPSPAPSPGIGEQLTLALNIADGENVAGYQATVQFDSSALRFISSTIGDYLPPGAFPLPATASGNMVTLAATSLAGESNGDGTLAALTFEVIAVKASTLMISDVILSDSAGTPSRPNIIDGRVVEPPKLREDVNRDGIVNILDLVLVSGQFGQSGQNNADVNGDGIVNILDLVLVAGAFGNTAAAPSSDPGALSLLTATDVGEWLVQARQLDTVDTTVQRGVQALEQLSAALTPDETSLLPNYPNPFNPETWIPYQLAKSADVTINIYGLNGQSVRQLPLGHQRIGIYQSKSRAAYWDGKNEFGESVASGIYFYTFTAGDFTATRKMLIRK